MIIPTNYIPTINSGNIAVEVEEKVKYGFKFSRSNILNNVGSLLSRKNILFKRVAILIIDSKVVLSCKLWLHFSTLSKRNTFSFNILKIVKWSLLHCWSNSILLITCEYSTYKNTSDLPFMCYSFRSKVYYTLLWWDD